MMSALPIRHRLANLLHDMRRFEEAEAELRETEAGYRRIGGRQSVPMQLQADLARVLEAQNLPDAAEAVRKRLANRLPPRAPVIHPLPIKLPRGSRASPKIVPLNIPLQLVTPLFGGAAEARKIDDVDVVRVPSVRGHLRFWWRTLHGGRLAGEELYVRERRLWGGAGDDTGGRSTVEIRVNVKARGLVDTSDVMPYGENETPGAYALWPARTSQGTRAQPAAPRREPGTRFSLHVTCHAGDETEVRAAVLAWVLFGGYGGRTRRGAGGLSIDGSADDRRSWLPADRTREAIRMVFQQDILSPIAARPRNDVPLLAGAALRLGRPTVNAIDAWTTALHWLRDFRQMQPGSGFLGSHDPSFARDRGDNRPGRSNWPEADKIRQLQSSGSDTRWAHEPRHNAKPAWPRAGFGLPIVAQFQRTDRKTRTHYPPPGEPRDFELRWRKPKGPDGRQEVHDRLASPLIVKALALGDGQFVPCALWLYRAYPAGGEIILAPNDSRSAGSAAAFDVLVADGDTARYAPLARPPTEHPGERLRNAFFDWLVAKDRSVRAVAP
jgi:CRISPR-associated protein Cmr1